MAKPVPSTSENVDTSSSNYQTIPLSTQTSTRLLTLHNGSGDDDIKCSLTSVNLDTNPRYEALSYCWGSPENPQSVLLDGLLVDVRDAFQCQNDRPPCCG